MPTGHQDRSFAEEMSSCVESSEVKMQNSTLDSAIQWIQSNLSPDEVFSVKELQEWAESNGYTKD